MSSWLSLFLVTFPPLKSTLSDMNEATLVFFWSVLPWCVYMNAFHLNLFCLLKVHFCDPHITVLLFNWIYICFTCSLIGICTTTKRPFTFNAIIDMAGVNSTLTICFLLVPLCCCCSFDSTFLSSFELINYFLVLFLSALISFKLCLFGCFY